MLASDQPSEKHGYDRIDVCVSRDLRCGYMLKQPDVCGKSNQRTKRYEIPDGQPSCTGPICAMEAAKRKRKQSVHHACKCHFPAGCHKRFHGELKTPRENRSNCPTERAEH